jgi:uncharacterized protein
MTDMRRILSIKVKPNARASRLEELADGSWIAHLKAPPVDGKANAELIALVTERFGCAKSKVTIKTGAGARIKRVRIETD